MAFGVQDSLPFGRSVSRREGLCGGDAAHVHSPTAGQGIVTGMQDAMNLTWKLGRVLRGAPENLFDTYEDERRPKAAEVLKETDRTFTPRARPDYKTGSGLDRAPN